MTVSVDQILNPSPEKTEATDGLSSTTVSTDENFESPYETVFRRRPGVHYDKENCDGRREHYCRECAMLICACAPCDCVQDLLTLDEVLAAADLTEL